MNLFLRKRYPVSYWRSFSRYAWNRFLEDRCTFIASSLTLTTLLSLVPLMSVALAIFSAFPDFTELIADVQDFLFRNFVPAAGEIVQKYIQDFVSQAQRLKTIGIIFLIVTALLMMATIDNAFNTIWRVRARRQWVRIFLLYWAILTLGPILVGFSVGITSYFVSLPIISDAAEQVGGVISTVLPFLLTSVALTMAYISIPNCKIKTGHAVSGGIVASMLFELAKRGFAFYITTVPTYKLVFGAFATIPIFLLWIYLSWLIVLFGAEIVYCLGVFREDGEKSGKAGFTEVLKIVLCSYAHQKKGEPVTREIIVKELGNISEDEVDRILSSLISSKIIGELNTGSYVLQWSLNELTLIHLYRLLKSPLPDGNEAGLPPSLKTVFRETDLAIEQFLSIRLINVVEPRNHNLSDAKNQNNPPGDITRDS
ncbi:MAG: virulence factor BrkB family protein [Thermodesulfobacteriota bacterium]